MEDKLKRIYRFLRKNRQYNHELQSKYYRSLFYGAGNKQERLISLMYKIASTQRQPKMDMLAQTYQKIYQDKKCMESFAAFVDKLNPGKEANFNNLFEGLDKQPGWGKKTAALFTKAIFQLHCGRYTRDMMIWKKLAFKQGDRLRLPVDRVILQIFEKLGIIRPTFTKINQELERYFTGETIEVWDDLWFWGFITQRANSTRFAFNENKYWNLEHANKNVKTLNAIRHRAAEFIDLLNSK